MNHTEQTPQPLPLADLGCLFALLVAGALTVGLLLAAWWVAGAI